MPRQPHSIWQNAPPIDPAQYPNRIRLERGEDWFADTRLAHVIGEQFRQTYDGSYTGASRMNKARKTALWNKFRQKYVWDDDQTKAVFSGWHTKLCKRVSDTVNKLATKKRSDPIPFMSEEDRDRMEAEKSTPGFIERSKAAKTNRNSENALNCTVHVGSVSAATYVKKKAAEGVNVNPSDVHAYIHCGRDAKGNPIWSATPSETLDEKFKQQCRELQIQEDSPEARNLYYKLAGGYKAKDKAVYGLGSATRMFYQVPPPAQGSSSRNDAPTPSLPAILTDRITAQDAIIAQMQSQLTQLSQTMQQQQAGVSPTTYYIHTPESPHPQPHPHP